MTAPEPKPDYWLNLAADLRQAADRLATLAGTPKPVNGARLTFYCGLLAREHVVGRPIVDALAATFNGTTKTARSGGSWTYEVDAKVGGLEVWSYTYIPAPEDTEKAALAARVAELEAQLAAGGAR
ncbi:hypothetical protein E1193_11775 [Micromonospora sp. KC606]|nr:hypothetical protein E1193_11775 [Micromonospora sp. KC606]